jgi:hypothetical protein
MASYTDKIPTFNPYVEQQPVDAMLKVGMYKQQKYEEGVKKIQTTIDNVAGLDIANEVQQKYLQSKLNALGNNLTFLAAGDFSDFSLVNSVNGMTKQIAKDEDVLNAVSSTAKLRAGYKKKAELAKKGLTDKNNDDYYDMYASEYVNSKDLKASFNADYIPHVNIVKKVQEALTNAGETSFTAEQLFVMNPNTNKPLVGPDGHYMYADVKTIDKLVTNKPAVMAAITNVMNEGSVKQQLGIDGWATYRNTEATDLLEPLKTEYDNERSRLQQQSIEISAMLNSTNLSPEQKELYTKASQDVAAALVDNDNTFMSLSKQAEDNPESFKQNYYTKEFKQRLMDQFIKNEESHTTGVNEGKQEQNWRDEMAFKKLQERNKVAYENANLAISRSNTQLNWLKFSADYEQDPVTGNWNKKPDPNAKGTGKTYDANKPLFSGATSGDKVNAHNIVQEDINVLSEEKSKLAFSLFADFVRTYKDNPNLSDRDVLNTAKAWAKQKGVSTEVYLDRYVSNIKNNYDVNGLTPPPNMNDEFYAYTNTTSLLNNKKNQYDSAKASADKEAGVDAKLKKLFSTKKTLNFNVNGTKITVEPRDMLGLITNEAQRVFKFFNKGGQAELLKNKNLTVNQRNLIANWDKLPWEMRQTVMAEFSSYTHGDGNLYEYKEALDKASTLFNDKLSKIAGVSDTVSGLLPMDTESKPTTIGKLATYVNSGGRNYAPGVNKETVLKALDNAKTISWNAKKPTNSREDWMGEIIVNDEDGKSYTITNVNRKDLATFTDATFTQYKDQPIQDAINMNEKTKSTNSVYMPGSPNAWRTAFYKGTQINPEVTNAGWGYRADVVRSGGGYRLVNYVKPPKAKGFITIYGAAIAADEYIIDNTYKTTTPAQLSAMYLNYLHNQTK